MKRTLLVVVTLMAVALTAGLAMAECSADHGKTADAGKPKTGS